MSSAKLVGKTTVELAAVLAGLRLLQHHVINNLDLPDGIDEIYSNGFTERRLGARPRGSHDDFDKLCESLNSKG